MISLDWICGQCAFIYAFNKVSDGLVFYLRLDLLFSFHSPREYNSDAFFSWKKIKPAVIVDKLIEALVDVIVPGKGAGESNWFWRNLRSLERDSDRSKCFSTLGHCHTS